MEVKHVINGKEVTQEEWDALPNRFDELMESRKTGVSHDSKCWPMVSKLGVTVLPEQVAEANEDLRLHGVNCEYDAKGHCHIPDQRAYARLLKHSGGYNKAEGFHGA